MDAPSCAVIQSAFFSTNHCRISTRSCNEMRTEIKKLHARLGKTIIYVTTIRLEAMTLADRIAVLSGGRVMQYATPDEIYHRPAARFVCRLYRIACDEFSSWSVSSDAATATEAGAVRIALPPALAKAAGSHAGQSVDLIRPEDLAIASERDELSVAGSRQPLWCWSHWGRDTGHPADRRARAGLPPDPMSACNPKPLMHECASTRCTCSMPKRHRASIAFPTSATYPLHAEPQSKRREP